MLSNLIRCKPYLDTVDSTFIIQTLTEVLRRIHEPSFETIEEVVWAVYFYLVPKIDLPDRV